jgi:ribosomal protein S18 acetylase RimI-like enzyme
MQILNVQSADQIEMIRTLFLEYAQSLDFNLCFQSFDEELASLPGKYAEPEGKLLIAIVDDQPAGCIAMRKLDNETCEMKRLWVQPPFRGRGIGEALVRSVMALAKPNYKKMRLDTVASSMASAVKLYKALGFHEIKPYTHNPVTGAMFMECDL